jgi:cellobiose phosphorylase
MFGVKARWDGLEIDPCLPKEMLPAKITRVFRGKKYEIEITENKRMFIPAQ